MGSQLEAIVLGAIFDFAGWLTTQDEPVTLSRNHDAAPVPPLIERWAQARGLDPNRASVEDWQHIIEKSRE